MVLFKPHHLVQIAHSPADQPVIIISINYRLGVFGNMFLKELVEEDPEWPTAFT